MAPPRLHAPRGALDWTRVLTPRLLLGFAAALTVMFVALFVGLASLRAVYDRGEAVAHTYSVKAALENLLATAVDAEDGVRGFVITGNPSNLRSYERARTAFPATFAKARALAGSNAEQQRDIDALSALTERQLAELGDEIALKRESGSNAATEARLADGKGQQAVDGIRTIVARMESREDEVLATEAADAARSYRLAQISRIAGIGMGLLALLGLLVSMARYGAARVRANHALEAKQAELREALALKDEFVAAVSHELRTPLNTIAGWAHMLETKPLKPDGIRAATSAISRSTGALRRLVEDLMDTSQLVSGRMRLNVGIVDLREVIQDAIDAVRLSADNKGVTLTRAVALDRRLVVFGDGDRLKQVAWNLLTNAIKFTPSGGHVTVALTSTQERCRLEVSDTGVGIARDFLPSVFDRFRQASPAEGGRHSIGLGLAIVRHLVDLHGGTATAYSAGLGQGATFVIELPRARNADGELEPLPSEAHHSRSS